MWWFRLKLFLKKNLILIIVVFLSFISFVLPAIYLSNLEPSTRKYIIGINMASMPWMVIQTLIFVGLLYLLHYGGGFSRFRKTRIKSENVNVRFSDIIGLEQAKKEAWEVVQLIKDRKKVKSIGGKIIKGVLLIGPPGCGKTMLAKAIATEADVPFLSVAGSEFVEIFVGVGAARVRKLFSQARYMAHAYGACIVFIDELEVIGRKRILYDAFGGGAETNSTQNQLLVEMDGLSDDDANVVVFGATNALEEILDEALLRPGRFDRKIFVGKPNLYEREKLFEYYLNKIKYDKTIDISRLARKTVYKTPAEIENIVKEAALIAARNDRAVVTYLDITQAIERIELGFAHRIVMTQREREITAYHEVGHLVVLYLTHPTRDVFKVSILNRGGVLGVVHSMPKDEFYLQDKESLLASIRVSVSGYMAEMIKFSSSSDGVVSDLAEATKIAHAMVWKLGMGSGGYLCSFSSIPEKEISDELVNRLNYEMCKIIENEKEKAEKVLRDNWNIVEEFVKLLLEKDELEYDEIVEVFRRNGIYKTPLVSNNGV
ncbi:MAG: AAA family ATPase [Elusimicrobiales bacterium]|nr:AAA family ATPase [Elusimicrobiales bacterium]